MALKRGIIGFDTHMPLPCSGGLQLGNRYFRCWKKDGHGSLDLVGAVSASCDVYFYQLGLKLGLDAILSDGVLMGFRDRSGIDLPSEQNPIYPATTAYFDKLYGPRNWSQPATVLNFSIGQGENTQTLINMVRFYEGLAGNGESREPFVVRRDPKSPTYPFGLTDAQLLGLRQALTAVAERGTASAIINATPGSNARVLQIAGKTGTAQNPHGLDHRWFIAMAPAAHPELIVGGIMENVGLHDPLVVRNVYLALRRYILGPDSVGAAVKVQISIPEDGGTALIPPAVADSVSIRPLPDSARSPDGRP
jgi:penicillin-binding protein 2